MIKTPVTQAQDGMWSMIVDADDTAICDGLTFEEATQIRVALNTHDALVAALEQITNADAGAWDTEDEVRTCIAIATEALKLAKGEP